jgi:hypothetical protein
VRLRNASPELLRPGYKLAGSWRSERRDERAAVTEIERVREFVERAYGELDDARERQGRPRWA